MCRWWRNPYPPHTRNSGGVYFYSSRPDPDEGRYVELTSKETKIMASALLCHPLRNRAELDRRERSCPPHGPNQRGDNWEAKLAFDEAFDALPRVRT